MSRLRLRGSVVHMPGAWGPLVPAAGAHVKIVDVDVGGNPSDEIWSGTTGPDGSFRGESSEWQDQKKMIVPVRPTLANPFPRVEERWVADPTDALVLQARLSQQTPQGNRETTVPFVFLGDDVPSPPVVVNWGPPAVVIARVNGAECRNPEEFARKMKAAVDAGGQRVEFEIYGASAATLRAQLDRPANELQAWIRQRLGLPPTTMSAVAELPTAFWVLVGIAILALAVGAAIAIVILALCLLYAIHKGYRLAEWDFTTTADGEDVFRGRVER